MYKLIIVIVAVTLVNHSCEIKKKTPSFKDYNVVWNTPSKDASGSMPCGGGDIGLNVWVENGDILFYMQRSGSLAEQNEYLKLGRIRLQLNPNPLVESALSFRQELKLREGYVDIQGTTKLENGSSLDVVIRIWVEVKRPVIHVEVDSDADIRILASYENWRQEEEILSDQDRRHSFITLHHYPGEVKLGNDVVEHTADGVLFYHRNPGEGGLLPGLLIKQQGLEEYRDDIIDDLANRTFGGFMTGSNFDTAMLNFPCYIHFSRSTALL